MKDKDFLMWIHDRLVHVYKENENVDFSHKLRNIIDNMDAEKETINTTNSSVYICPISSPVGSFILYEDQGDRHIGKILGWTPRGYVFVAGPCKWYLPNEIKVLDILEREPMP